MTLAIKNMNTFSRNDISDSALRPRRIDANLDAGWSGKELVGKGLDTVRGRLVMYVQH